jgi:uncharacterized protein (DUF1501 family)
MKRRDFVKNTALASSVFMVPNFIRAFDDVLRKSIGYKRLVIIHLDGGNDGLNTLIPFRNDIYYRNRPKLAISKKEVLRLTDEVGFHNSLRPLKNLYDQGYLCILNNVGYPNPDRSHFRSTDIWQTASSSNQYLPTGWVGRYLDKFGDNTYNAIEIGDSLSLTLKGKNKNGIATTDAQRLFRTSQSPYFKEVLNQYQSDHLSEHNLGYLYKTMISAESSAKYIYETSNTFSTKQTYQNTAFSKQLKTTAKFINSGIDTKVFYTSLSGFDTHAGQAGQHSRLLKQYSEGIDSFVKDLQQNNTFSDTLILTFSEFGRRVEQNAANGTDHGAANNVFIIGKNLKTQGLYNRPDNLKDLDANGDLKFEIDFRTIYATVLSKWLNAADEEVLNHNFQKLDFI